MRHLGHPRDGRPGAVATARLPFHAIDALHDIDALQDIDERHATGGYQVPPRRNATYGNATNFIPMFTVRRTASVWGGL